MIPPEKIEEWIREVEARPASAPAILRIIANRLSDLSKWNEELLDDNIQLRTGQRVAEYRQRIANLEYQLELLKRQVSLESSPVTDEFVSLLAYNLHGQVLHSNVNITEWVTGRPIATIPIQSGSGVSMPHLVLVSGQEEMLFLYDSGRTARQAVSAIPVLDPENLDWEEALVIEPQIGEELASLLPIAKMSLSEYCIQVSRRGYLKKFIETYFENHLAKDYIGSGVKEESDKTCTLVFGDKTERFVMVSHEGVLFSTEVNRIPLTIEEAIRLNATDYIISAFTLQQKPYLLIVTQNGKVIQREANWIEQAASFKTKGQPVISKERRATGVRVAGAAPVHENDWCLALFGDGQLIPYKMSDVFATGSLLGAGSSSHIISITVFSPPLQDGKGK